MTDLRNTGALALDDPDAVSDIDVIFVVKGLDPLMLANEVSHILKLLSTTIVSRVNSEKPFSIRKGSLQSTSHGLQFTANDISVDLIPAPEIPRASELIFFILFQSIF
jgi:hypothetical protein